MILGGPQRLLLGAIFSSYLKVHLPQNQFTSDMCIDRNTTIPFFATSKCAIEFIGKFNTKDERETDMMSSRWFTIPFKKQIINPLRFKPCPKCFAELVMSGAL